MQAFQQVTTAIRGVAIGFQAGSNVTTGDYNVLVGPYAGQLFGAHASNIAIGAFAGQNSTADNSTFIGQNVGYYLEGDHNVGIGRQPLQGVANSTAAKNIGMGYKALYQADTGADENVAIGYQSMMDVTTGTLNVAIGAYAATGMTTGQFMSFLVSLLLANQPVKALGNLNISVQEGLAGACLLYTSPSPRD